MQWLCLLLCLLAAACPVAPQPCAAGYFGEQSQGCFDIDECAAGADTGPAAFFVSIAALLLLVFALP